jgi:hypothetical protein
MKNPVPPRLVAPWVALALLALGTRSEAGYSVTTFNYSAVSNITYVSAINDAGQTAGYFVAPGVPGFIRDASGAVTTFTAPSPLTVSGINRDGQVVGSYGGLSFVRDASGALTTFSVDATASTGAIAINDAGAVAGNYSTPTQGTTGFLRDASGHFTPVAVPGSDTSQITALNNAGEVAGTFFPRGSQDSLPFFRDAPGSFTTIDLPGYIIAFSRLALNDSGQVAGVYHDQLGGHGFIRDRSGALTTFNVPGIADLTVGGINGLGQVVGTFGDKAGVHGYVRDASGFRVGSTEI